MDRFTFSSLQKDLQQISDNFTLEKNGNTYFVTCRWSEGTVGFEAAKFLKWPVWKGLHARSKNTYMRAMRKLESQYRVERSQN